MNAFQRWWRRDRGLFAASYAYMNEYRSELLLWALANSLSFILMGVWYEATHRGSFALAPLDVVRYFLAVFVVRQLTVVWVIWDFEAQVHDGKLAAQLLQPVDPGWRHVIGHVAERAARLPFSVLIVILFFFLYPQALFVPSLSTLATFIALSILAFALRFLIQYTIALGCFWTERASALETLNFMLYMFLGGAIAPLDFFPPAMKAFALYTPFPYLIYFPCRVLLGGVGSDEVVRAVVVIGAWSGVFWVLNRLLWRLGLRQFSAMGS